MRDKTRSVNSAVSWDKRCGASRRMRAKVDERHWFTGSSVPAEDGCNVRKASRFLKPIESRR